MPANNKKPMSSPASSSLRSIFSLVLLTLWALVSAFSVIIARPFNKRVSETLPMRFHRGCCRILALANLSIGEPTRHRPTLYVCNHISYLDVFILGGVIPGFFIAKSEVANWPVLGPLARLQNTLFFERRQGRAHTQVNIMRDHLKQGANLILFPEGTSTAGRHVEPFKSSLFSAAEQIDAQDVLIQPVTLTYTRYRGQPLPDSTRDCFAWYGTMPFASHFFKMAGMTKLHTELHFHEAVKLSDFESRKACAEYCQAKVSTALTDSLRV